RYIRIVRHWLLSHFKAAKAQVAYDVAIKASEQRFRDIAETAGDWIYEMDVNLRFSYISDRFFQIFPSQLPKSSARPGRSLPAANSMSPIGKSIILTSAHTAPFGTLPTVRRWRTGPSAILKSAANQFSAVMVSSLGIAALAAMSPI